MGKFENQIQGKVPPSHTPEFSAVAASTADVTISNPGTAVFDGVTLTAGERALLKNQTDAKENGLYTFNGSAVAMTRTPDFDEDIEIKYGAKVYVTEGTVAADQTWKLTSDEVEIGTDNIVFTLVIEGGGTVQNANLSIQASDEGTVAGNARAANAVDLQTDRANADEVAGGVHSGIGGGEDNKITAAGEWSYIAAGLANVISAAKAFATGWENVVSAAYSSALGGYGNTLAHKYSTVFGRGAVTIAEGSCVEGTYPSTYLQEHRIKVGNSITSAAEAELFTDTSTGRVVIPASRTGTAEGFIQISDASDADVTDTWRFSANFRRDSGSTLTMTGFTLTPLIQTTTNSVRLACDENAADEFAIFVTVPDGVANNATATASYKIQLSQ